MKEIYDNLASLGRTRLLILGSMGLGMVFALVFGVGTVLSPNYVPLYNNLSAATASQLVNTLEQAGFKVKVSRDGSTVNVAQGQVPRARMALADKGLPSEGEPGWELFDKSSGLGMNSFMQKVNRLRALEGELARSIQSLNTVEAARVHLVLREREAFSRKSTTPSASVLVRSRYNTRLSQRQALSIRALVAAAVPEMAPDKVIVISSDGEVILSGNKSDTGKVTLESTKVGIEDRLSNNISDILNARVGMGNARVQVSVSLNHERKVTTAKNFDPDQRVVRSTESSEETSSDGAPNGGSVDVGGNLPSGLGAPAGKGASSKKSAITKEVINYEIGSSNTETVREIGEIKHISVAVLINSIRSVDGNGNVTYKDRSQDELDSLRRLIESASGINLKRGDSISVESLQFVDYSNDIGAPVGISFRQMLSNNLASILRGGVALGLVAAVLMLGVRPTLKLILELPKPAAEPALLDARDPNVALPGNPTVKIADNHNTAAISMLGAPTGDTSETLPPFISEKGNFERQRIDAFTNIVEQEPEESVKIINHWLAEGA